MNSSVGSLIAAYQLRKEYLIPYGSLPVLKGVDLEIRSGELAFIFGRSGSGKSTFLHLLAGLDRPSSGRIFFEGEDLSAMTEKELSRLRNLRIGLVFQFYHLLPELTVFENVLLPSMIAGKRDDKWARECLKKVKLYSRMDHYPSELSGGEQQRVAIARALINHPSIVLCDEPTGNLDEETAGTVLNLINEMNRTEGQAFLIVTHDEALAWRCDRVYRLVDGVLLPEGHQPVKLEKLP